MTFTFKLSRRLAGLAVCAAASMSLGACAGGDPTAASDGTGGTLAAVSISPKSSRIGVNQALPFEAQGHSSLGDSMTVSIEWSATGGTITSDGVFSSSATGTFKVIGRGKGGGRPPADTAVVVVDSNAPPASLVSIAVTPGTASLAPGQSQSFTATGKYSDNHTAALTSGVTWQAGGGTISGGKYTAGSTAGSYTVTAASGGVSGSAAVTIASSTPTTRVDTIFAENWESGSKAAWTDENSGSLHTILTDASAAHSGSRVLRVTFPAGTEPGYLQHWFMPGYDSVFVRFWFKLDPSWVGNTKLLDLAGNRIDDQWSAAGEGGRCPTGTDFFSTWLVMPTSNSNDVPSLLRMYTYYPGMPKQPDGVTCWGSYGLTDGATYATPPALTRGVWHKAELWVKLNAIGQANGAEKYWLDGQLVGNWPNMVLRKTTDLRLNRVMLGFSHAGAGPASVPRTLYIDDLVILKARPTP
jgi:hypothetical protein